MTNLNNDIKNVIKNLSNEKFTKNITSKILTLKKCYSDYIVKNLRNFYLQTSESSNMIKKNSIDSAKLIKINTKNLNDSSVKKYDITKKFNSIKLCKFCRKKKYYNIYKQLPKIKNDLEILQVRCIRVMQFLHEHRKLTSQNYYHNLNTLVDIKNNKIEYIIKTSNKKNIKSHIKSIKRKFKSSKKHKMSSRIKFIKDNVKLLIQDDKDSGILEDIKSQEDDDIKNNEDELKMNEKNLNSDDLSAKEIEFLIQKITDDLVMFENKAKKKFKKLKKSSTSLVSSSQDEHKNAVNILLNEIDTDWSNEEDDETSSTNVNQ